MKTIYHVRDAYNEFFFDSDFEIIHMWHENDANYRREYMLPLFEKLGIGVVEIGMEFNDKVKNKLIEHQKSSGYYEESDWT